MDALAFLLGIVMIVSVSGYLGFVALTLYHDRRLRELRATEHRDLQKFQIMQQAIEKSLPPGRYKFDD